MQKTTKFQRTSGEEQISQINRDKKELEAKKKEMKRGNSDRYIMTLKEKEEDWEVVKGEYRTPEVCPWCGGEIEEKLLEVKFLEGKVRVSKFPKMVCSKCGHSFMNDEQAAYYERLQEDLVLIYSIESRKSELQTVEA